MINMVESIADCLVQDHIDLMKEVEKYKSENEALRAELAEAKQMLAIAKEYIYCLEYCDSAYYDYGVTRSDEAKAYYAAIKEKDND